MNVTNEGLVFGFDNLMEQYNLDVSSFDRNLQQKIFNVDNLIEEYHNAVDNGATEEDKVMMHGEFNKKDAQITSDIRIWLQMRGEQQAQIDAEEKANENIRIEAEQQQAQLQANEQQAKAEELNRQQSEASKGSVGFFNW